MTDLSEVEEDLETPSYRGFRGRRRKAAFTLTMIWSGTIALHLFSWGIWVVLGLTTLVGIHALRIMLARPLPAPEPLAEADQADWPHVSLLVAAKNEEAVIGKLV
ncbi:MAG TPA: glycosyltransferase family 2 protein, partial [Allocoleopsis sp.]